MKEVTKIEDTLSQASSEISINKGLFIGYVVSINDVDIVIENYDMEHDTVKISDVDTLKNMDEDIYFSRAVNE